MSLGLGDLNKNRKIRVANSTSSHNFPSGAWAKSHTARPWTQSGTSRSVRSRRSRVETDAVMNDEWVNHLSTPLAWMDFREHSTLLRLHDFLANLEEQAHSRLLAPLDRLQCLIGEATEESQK